MAVKRVTVKNGQRFFDLYINGGLLDSYNSTYVLLSFLTTHLDQANLTFSKARINLKSPPAIFLIYRSKNKLSQTSTPNIALPFCTLQLPATYKTQQRYGSS